jgi:tetratricopeptide (TPR) repeat protein
MNIAKLIDKGEEALKKKNFDYAIEILLQAVSFGPNNRRARELLRAVFGFPAKLGMVVAGLSKKTNPEAYMMACEKFLTKDPKSRAANMALGDAAALGGHLDVAIFAYETASEHNPGDAAALKKLGQLLWKNGQIGEAHEVYDKVVRLRPQDQEAVKARKNLAAEMSLKETGFESARSSRDLVRDKDAAGKLEQETRIYQTEHGLEARRAEIEKKLEAEPNDVGALQDFADIAKRLKDWDTALQAMDRAVELKPNDTTLVFARGDLNMDRLEQQKLELLREGREAEAEKITAQLLDFQVEEYRKRVKIYPTDLNLRFKLGDLLYGKGLMDESIGEFQQTVRDPKFRAESQLRLGRAFKLKSQYDLALRQLEQALEGQTGLTERVKEIRYEIGDVYHLMSRKAEAKSEFGKIYEQDITYRDVADRLAELEKEAG